MSRLWAGFGTSTAQDTQEATREAVSMASAGLAGQKPGLAIVTATVEHDAEKIFAAVSSALPGVPIHGVTTSLGVLSKEGIVSDSNGVVAILLLAASEMISFAVGCSVLGDDAIAAGRRAAEQIAKSAQTPPRVLIVNGSPGREEDVLAGIAQVLPDVPAFGGSAADHAILGEWSVFTKDGVFRDAVSVAAICGDVAFSGALLAPFVPTTASAKVTGGQDRKMTALDGQPAADVLNRWLDGALSLQVAEGGNILAQTALRPLAIRHDVGGNSHFVTLHPAHIHAEDRSVDLFARIRPGDTVCMMSGSVQGLTAVLSELHAQTSRNLPKEKIRAAILIYCAGCAGAVGGSLHGALREHLLRSLADVPVLGLCTFGEQGYIPGLGNVHQDLSVSLLLLGEP
ncbi:MAG TPA: FIST N-terminal domain-containing protein [Pseudomonadota bacterium]|nr:FIST N-terminal domain-containing protein [Pseudomonadota bacterium]